MVAFRTLWDNHVGRGHVCDTTDFGNQCAMRMGQALEDSGIKLAGYPLKRCTTYSRKYRDHKPGHIRAAQDLANVFYRNPKLLGPMVKRHILTGSMNDNLNTFARKCGMVFIMNGWGNTDHIDVWDGNIELMKGSADTAEYRKRGKQVWFWEMS
ncbi:T6SS effector amidase Tae4 family protein [Bosea sp. (in: a-proteobacteria)]|uniref:T6SS effector amidase Tae4 family protein n=1 Tax=Bosea sp. (in: a-proteobacteria) TaxID=1871050 RepID=UPI0040346E82